MIILASDRLTQLQLSQLQTLLRKSRLTQQLDESRKYLGKIFFHAAQPDRILERRPVTGLAPGERLVGIDFRVAKGVLYALSQAGRLYTLDIPSGALRPVGSAPAALALQGTVFGFDFNPAADRIRVVSNMGQNLRLHPDTGAVVDGDAAVEGVQPDPSLRYAWGDVNEIGRAHV